jgi:hypothetical protein
MSFEFIDININFEIMYEKMNDFMSAFFHVFFKISGRSKACGSVSFVWGTFVHRDISIRQF